MSHSSAANASSTPNSTSSTNSTGSYWQPGNHYLATSINCDTYMSEASNSDREQEQQELERDEDGDEDEPPMDDEHTWLSSSEGFQVANVTRTNGPNGR
jgi:hypothetical protein